MQQCPQLKKEPVYQNYSVAKLEDATGLLHILKLSSILSTPLKLLHHSQKPEFQLRIPEDLYQAKRKHGPRDATAPGAVFFI